MTDPQVRALNAGAPLQHARAALILLHGRGAAADDMLSLAETFGHSDIAYLAPQAPGYSWYPYSFLAPIVQNEPALTRSLGVVEKAFDRLLRDGFAPERVVLLGFSQGGCLALEYAARNARRYGGLVGLSAGLIGPEGTSRNYAGSLSGTPVFLGCSDVDGHIPLWRVQESTQSLRTLGGEVTERIYPGMGHTISDDEIRHIARMLAAVTA